MEYGLIDQALEIALLFDEQGLVHYGNKKAKELLDYNFDNQSVSMVDIFPSVCSLKNHQIVVTLPKDDDSDLIMAYRKNRTCFAVEVRFFPLQGQVGMYVCFAIDISKRDYFEKRANQAGLEVEAAQQVKTQFVANVTHELRTPVNGILGNVRELDSMETAPEKRRLLDLIERGCKDMHAIINNILDFSKLDAGKFTLEKRQFNFREMMDYVRGNHINKITEKGLQLFITISPDVPEYIIGDELRIKQVLNNLLSNATKFTPMGKIVVEVVKTAQIGNRIELFFMVIDSGIGIAIEDQDKLFKSFSQVEASTTRKYGGTGLGLNISKQLVELMDGSIHVESEKNKGTMFSFHIWVDVSEEASSNQNNDYQPSFEVKVPSLSDVEGQEEIWRYGSKENLTELQKKMSRLILSVEMANWEKAEMFMETIRQLTMEAPKEVKSSVLRLKMAVQKEDYDKAITAFNTLKEQLPGD
ncbi:MAG: ATP-binding protein [Lachnospiraceae bacterium]